MKHSCALLMLLAACAAPPSRPVPLVHPEPSGPSAFQLPIPDREPETRRYRIKPEEILADASTPELRYYMGSEGSSGFSPVSPAGAAGAVARLIREIVVPESWDADPRRAVYVDGEDLVVRHAPEVLECVGRFIETLKANRAATYAVRARFISVTAGDLAFLEHLPMVRGGLGGVVGASSLNGTPLRGVGGRTLTAPKLTLYHAQKGSIRIGANYAYIAGYEKNGPVYDPKPSVEWAGVEVTARVVANGPGSDRRLLTIAVTSRDVPGIPWMTAVELGNRTYEMPMAAEKRVECAFVLGANEALVLLVPDVKGMNGIAGRLADEAAPPARMTLVLVEVERAE